jgi:hypothetical protein
MSRYENLIKTVNAMNKNGASHDAWLLMLLTDIAMSLAVIADEVKDKKGI